MKVGTLFTSPQQRACPCPKDEKKASRGSVAVITAAALPVLVGLTGLGIDSARLYQAHTKLQSAVDSAALAGSIQLPYDPDMDRGDVTGAVHEYMNLNYPEASVLEITPGGGFRSVRVVAEASVDTLLLGIVNANSQKIQAEAVAGFNNLEIVFAIDNSGSMKGTPIQQTNQAAAELVDLIMPEDSAPAVKIGLVPFRGKVHIDGGVDGLPDGCRNVDGTLNDGLHPEYKKPEYRYPSHIPLRVSSDTCSSIPKVQALSNSKHNVIQAINSQTARGAWSGTVISEGIKWGREVLTPEAPFTEGDESEEMRKVLILLTDGDTEDGMCGGPYTVSYKPNNYYTNAFYGALDMSSHCENGGALNQAMLDEAEIAKDAGIEIFVIRYGVSDSVDVQLMKQIASSEPGTDDHYFDAPSAYDIDDMFKLIGKQLGWRLMK